MNEEWFSVESSRNLVWFSLLSLLSLLSVYVERGRHRTLFCPFGRLCSRWVFCVWRPVPLAWPSGNPAMSSGPCWLWAWS